MSPVKLSKLELVKLPNFFFDRKFRERMIGEFFDLPIKNVEKRMKNASKNLASEWKKIEISKRESEFYTKTAGYIFELEEWHIEDKIKQAGMIAIGSQAKNRSFLEYGCGIADTSITASVAGAKHVCALDLPSKTMEYARFRVKKFPLKSKICFFESKTTSLAANLPKNCFDLVSAEDVFEHVSNPTAHAKLIYASLKEGGSLYFSTEFIHSDVHPMHLKTNARFHGVRWLYELEKIGYKIVSPCHAIKVGLK